MIAEIMESIRNYFAIPGKVESDTFTISNGSLGLPFLTEGQYFKIVGSVFNDGVYQYPHTFSMNETFTGYIYPLAVPSDFLDLVKEIEAWQEKNAAVSSGIYQSESFGGYSYTLATNSDGSLKTWRDVFNGRLRKWRKL